MLTTKINGYPVPTIVGSVKVEHNIEERSTCNLRVHDKNGEYEFQFGNLIEIFWDNDYVFRGKILSSIERVNLDGSIEHSIDAADFHIVTDRRLVVRAYENKSITYMIEDLFEKYMSSEGITLGNIKQGMEVLGGIAFDFVSLTEVLDQLSELSGCYWNIDERSRFYFEDRGTRIAPSKITPGISLYGQFEVRNKSDKYRNVQVITRTNNLTSEIQETFTGDGERRTFTLGYDVSSEPTIEKTNDGGTTWQPLTISQKAAQSQSDFYYSVGSPVITGNSLNTPIQTSEVLRVTYIGQYEIVVTKSDPDEILNTIQRETVGTGRYEHVEGKDITQPIEVTNGLAEKLLNKYKTVGKVIKLRTRKPGFKVGQIANVEDNRGSYEALISRVTLTFDDKYTPVYIIIAFSGPAIRTWAQVFLDLKRDRASNNYSAIDSGVTIPFEFDRDWLETDDPNIFKYIYPSQTLLPSISLYPSFADADRIKIVEMRDINGDPIARTGVTSTTGTTELTSIATFSGLDGLGQEVYSFAFYAGNNASLAFGTGILLDVQTQTTNQESGPWLRDTSFERWQITRIDRRWA